MDSKEEVAQKQSWDYHDHVASSLFANWDLNLLAVLIGKRLCTKSIEIHLACCFKRKQAVSSSQDPSDPQVVPKFKKKRILKKVTVALKLSIAVSIVAPADVPASVPASPAKKYQQDIRFV